MLYCTSTQQMLSTAPEDQGTAKPSNPGQTQCQLRTFVATGVVVRALPQQRHTVREQHTVLPCRPPHLTWCGAGTTCATIGAGLLVAVQEEPLAPCESLTGGAAAELSC